MKTNKLIGRVVFGVIFLSCGVLSAQTFTDLHNFSWNSGDGTFPRGGLTSANGTLYGTTQSGSGGGCVYQINPDGSGFAVIYAVGGEPLGGVVLVGNTLYGTTYTGGDNGSGSVFSVNTNGGNFTVLHSFASAAAPSYDVYYQTNADGIMPFSGLVYADGALYGTTSGGGNGGYGTVYKLNLDGSGFTVLYNFSPTTYSGSGDVNADGASPQAHLVESAGTLYGTTSSGGLNGGGTIFALDTNGVTYTVLHQFDPTTEGSQANALTLSGGLLYGSCEYGGSNGYGGTIFSLNPNTTAFTVLYSFGTGAGDGATAPDTDLSISGQVIYGATMNAASNHSGEVFSLSTAGDNFAALHYFTPVAGFMDNNSDGMYPNSLLLAGGVLYGTANNGGPNAAGTVFSLSSNVPYIFRRQFAPVLGVNLSGDTVVLSWTTNSDNGINDFSVQYATNLVPPVSWITLDQTASLVNDQHVVTNTPAGPVWFYRLFRPDPGQ